ncbi:hypothetical protein LCGC14_2663860, partial [marine sediment metagenome]
MSKCRVFSKPDKSVLIVIPAPKSRRPGETEEEWLDRVFTMTVRKSQEALDAWLEKPEPVGEKELEKHRKSVDFLKNNLLVGLPHNDIDLSELPLTKEDRESWEFDENSKKIKVNQVKKQAKDQE